MLRLTSGIITRQLLEPSPTQVGTSELTKREREVLALVARGFTNKQIAGTLYVSEKTARNHVSHILVKLELSRRSEAAAVAIEQRLVPPRRSERGVRITL